jgi:hypothetical protein
MRCVERLQHILIEIHNSIHIPELARWNAFRDQIRTTAQESVSKLGELVIEHAKSANQAIQVLRLTMNAFHI